MIGKVLQNNNFRETTRYVLDKTEARLLIGTVIGYQSDVISREFLMSKDLNPQIERPVYHLIDSYSYEDAATKDLSDEFLADRAIEHFAGLVVSARAPKLLRRDDKAEYKQQVESFIETELYEYQWFCATHEDTQHKHTHLVASRINLIDGRCIPTWQDKERSHRICREIEREHGLQPLKSFYEVERRSPTRGQREKWEKTGIPPVMVVMQEAIDQEVKLGHSLDAMMVALQENYGIETSIGLRNGKPGIVFEKVDDQGKSVRMSGSQLGRGYTYPAIQGRLVPELETDAPVVEEVEQAESVEILMRREQVEYAQQQAEQKAAEAQATTDRSILMLDYSRKHLININRNQAETSDGLYLIERDPNTKLITIVLTSRQAGEPSKIIAQGRYTAQGWQVSIALATEEDYDRFTQYQERQQQKQQAKVRKGDRDRER